VCPIHQKGVRSGKNVARPGHPKVPVIENRVDHRRRVALGNAAHVYSRNAEERKIVGVVAQVKGTAWHDVHKQAAAAAPLEPTTSERSCNVVELLLFTSDSLWNGKSCAVSMWFGLKGCASGIRKLVLLAVIGAGMEMATLRRRFAIATRLYIPKTRPFQARRVHSGPSRTG